MDQAHGCEFFETGFNLQSNPTVPGTAPIPVFMIHLTNAT